MTNYCRRERERFLRETHLTERQSSNKAASYTIIIGGHENNVALKQLCTVRFQHFFLTGHTAQLSEYAILHMFVCAHFFLNPLSKMHVYYFSFLILG